MRFRLVPAKELLRTESTFQRCINYVDINYWAILIGGRFSELHPISQGCSALTFALARLSCSCYLQLLAH